MSVDRRAAWPYDEQGEPGAFVYQRYAHPTGAAAEEALGALEGGDALLFSSGTAAVTGLRVRAVPARIDDRPGGGRLLRHRGDVRAVRAVGAEVVEYDQTGAPPADADVVWVEAPANPLLTLPNWEAVRGHSGVVVCDATASTPVFLRALDEGAAVVTPLRDEVPDRPPRRAARRDRHARPGPARPAL